jgi:hypothetical protein
MKSGTTERRAKSNQVHGFSLSQLSLAESLQPCRPSARLKRHRHDCSQFRPYTTCPTISHPSESIETMSFDRQQGPPNSTASGESAACLTPIEDQDDPGVAHKQAACFLIPARSKTQPWIICICCWPLTRARERILRHGSRINCCIWVLELSCLR